MYVYKKIGNIILAKVLNRTIISGAILSISDKYSLMIIDLFWQCVELLLRPPRL